jgi:putative hydrolase of the HAD superfamily
VIFDIDDTLFDTTALVKKARMNAVDAMVKSGVALKSEPVYNSLRKIVAKYGANYDQHFDRLLELLGHEYDPKIIAAGIVAYIMPSLLT